MIFIQSTIFSGHHIFLNIKEFDKFGIVETPQPSEILPWKLF